MEKTKLKLIEFIINEANTDQIYGLEELTFFGDIECGLNNFFGDEKLEEYKNSLKNDFKNDFRADIEIILDYLQENDIENAKNLLNELLLNR